MDRPVRHGRRPRPACHHRPAATLLVVLVAALVGLSSGCRSGGRAAPPPTNPGGVVVTSFNFPENELVATAYALVLRQAGIPVRLELGLGPRELVQPALRQGLVDIVPEYLGTALGAVAPDSPADRRDATAVWRALQDALRPWRLQALTPAAAQNRNGFAVTRATADRLGLRRVSDLAPVAGGLTLAGPTECPQRLYCLVGLADVYGVHVGRFVAFDAQDQRVDALRQGVADVAVVFTTDGALLSGDLVPLEDDRGLQPVENLVPVVSSRAVDRYGSPLVDGLDAVSSRLTSEALTFLNWRVVVAGRDVDHEARAWLQRQGLLPR